MGRIEYKVKKLFEMRAYRFKELCSIYKVSPMTLRKWLQLIGVRLSPIETYYRIPQMEIVAGKIGLPYMIYDIDYDEAKECTKKFQPFEVRPYKLKELAGLYKVDPKTLKKWIHPFKDEVGELVGGYYWIPQIEAIINNIGLPYCIYESTEDKNITKAA